MFDLTLSGKVVVNGTIKAETGLHIGGATTGIDIGGVDNPVIKDHEGKPYIPGSSLKGKMRSLLEKDLGLAADEKRVWVVRPNEKGEKGISIHLCNNNNCQICNIFGRTNGDFSKIDYNKTNKTSDEKLKIDCTTPTRLIVRDAHLIKETIPEDVKKNLDLEWTEVKWENAIDRITSAANPRQTERVPAGAKFEFEMIYNVFDGSDKDNLKQLFKTMKLLEDDYLGGQGSRGYGKIKFENIGVYWNSRDDYESGNLALTDERKINGTFTELSDIVNNFEAIKGKIQ